MSNDQQRQGHPLSRTALLSSACTLALTLLLPLSAIAERAPGGGGGGGGSGAEPEEIAIFLVGALSLSLIAWRQRRPAREER